jgi:hypothetical protein
MAGSGNPSRQFVQVSSDHSHRYAKRISPNVMPNARMGQHMNAESGFEVARHAGARCAAQSDHGRHAHFPKRGIRGRVVPRPPVAQASSPIERPGPLVGQRSIEPARCQRLDAHRGDAVARTPNAAHGPLRSRYAARKRTETDQRTSPHDPRHRRLLRENRAPPRLRHPRFAFLSSP